jgi:hypothetical protein
VTAVAWSALIERRYNFFTRSEALPPLFPHPGGKLLQELNPARGFPNFNESAYFLRGQPLKSLAVVRNSIFLASQLIKTHSPAIMQPDFWNAK